MSAIPTPEQVTCRHCPATHRVTSDTVDELRELLVRDDLLAGGMPYIGGWLIAVDWTAYCPAHVDRIHTVAETPTSQPCPSWCAEGHGHPLDLALASPDADSRTHEATLGDPAGLHVAISAIETVVMDVDGVRVHVGDPTIELSELGALTADQAEELTKLLNQATQQLQASA